MVGCGMSRAFIDWNVDQGVLFPAAARDYVPEDHGEDDGRGLPPWMKTKIDRLAKIREAKAALEREARERAKAERERQARRPKNKPGRKYTVEPVFGQIKEGRGIRRFLLRGLEKVRCEWQIICATHNLRKLVAARA